MSPSRVEFNYKFPFIIKKNFYYDYGYKISIAITRFDDDNNDYATFQVLHSCVNDTSLYKILPYY